MLVGDPQTAVLDLIDRVRGRSRRVVVGIAGAPGSGKSSFAAELVANLSRHEGEGRIALLPMDGFHLDNATLEAKGLLHVKGAPQTFDIEGFVALLERVKRNDGAQSYPIFDRVQDCTIPDAEHLSDTAEIVIVEGNYLLLQQGAWSALKDMFDATIMLSVPLPELRQRLVARWLEHGLSPEDAVKRAEGNDMVNARTVIEHSAAADLIIPFSQVSDATARVGGQGRLQC